MKSIYGVILGTMVIIGLATVGCTPPPPLPVVASDGEGGSISVDWSGYETAGVAGPYTVLRATNPGMVGATPVATGTCGGSISGTSCVDDTALADTAYFYVIQGSGGSSPPDGGHHGTLGSGMIDPDGEWSDAFTAAREYAVSSGQCDDLGFPYPVCTADCLEGGTLTQEITAISATDYYAARLDVTNCDAGDYVIHGTSQGTLTDTGGGYLIGVRAYTHQVGSNSGQSFSVLVLENLGKLVAPSNGYATATGNWDDTEFTEIEP